MASVILEKIGDFPEGFSIPESVQLKARYQIQSEDFEIPLPDMDCVGIEFVGIGAVETPPEEFEIERQGSCDQCGYCCGECSHLYTSGPKAGQCKIYNKLSDFCQTHDSTHEDCIPPPHQPYSEGICNYPFIVITPDLDITGEEVVRMYWVPKNVDLVGRWIR